MLNFQDIPDELVLKILSYPEAKDLISCGQVSKRIRRISRDSTLWVTANLEKKIVKTELLEMILGKGCRILNLRNSTILGSLSSNIKSQLTVLKLSRPIFNQGFKNYFDCESVCDCNENTHVLEELLCSCCSLQHLTIEGVILTPKMAESICKNGKTLQILNLNGSDLDISNEFKSNWHEIIKYCQELKEVDFAYVNNGYGMTTDEFQFFAKNIPPNVEKLNLSGSLIRDYQVEILLRRCNKIKALSLEGTWMIDSLTTIRQCLNSTLEELSLGSCDDIRFTGFLGLKSMPRLKILNLYYKKDGGDEGVQYLRKHLPHMMIKVSHEIIREAQFHGILFQIYPGLLMQFQNG